MSPFSRKHLEQQIIQPTAPKPPVVPSPSRNKAMRVARIMGHLSKGPAHVRDLAEVAGVSDTFYVYGLLSTHLDDGRIKIADNVCSLNPDYIAPKLLDAAAMLRKAGWTVIEPERK